MDGGALAGKWRRKNQKGKQKNLVRMETVGEDGRETKKGNKKLTVTRKKSRWTEEKNPVKES